MIKLSSFTVIFLSLFAISHFTYAQKNEVIAQCNITGPDYNLTYTLYSDFNSSLNGKVLNEPVNCALDFEKIKDERKSPSIVNYRVYNYRQDSNCNKDLSFDLKRGLEDVVTLVIYPKHADLFIFEGHKAIPCSTFRFKEASIIKAIPYRGIDTLGLSKNRKEVKLKLRPPTPSKKMKVK